MGPVTQFGLVADIDRGDHVQQRCRIVVGHGELSMLWADEPGGNRLIQEREQTVIVTRHVQEPDRLGVHAKLGLGPHLKGFFQRPKATGQGNEPVGRVSHGGLARMHALDHAEFGQSGMRNLQFC